MSDFLFTLAATLITLSVMGGIALWIVRIGRQYKKSLETPRMVSTSICEECGRHSHYLAYLDFEGFEPKKGLTNQHLWYSSAVCHDCAKDIAVYAEHQAKLCLKRFPPGVLAYLFTRQNARRALETYEHRMPDFSDPRNRVLTAPR